MDTVGEEADGSHGLRGRLLARHPARELASEQNARADRAAQTKVSRPTRLNAAIADLTEYTVEARA
jgi:hypothetical protein